MGEGKPRAADGSTGTPVAPPPSAPVALAFLLRFLAGFRRLSRGVCRHHAIICAIGTRHGTKPEGPPGAQPTAAPSHLRGRMASASAACPCASSSPISNGHSRRRRPKEARHPTPMHDSPDVNARVTNYLPICPFEFKKYEAERRPHRGSPPTRSTSTNTDACTRLRLNERNSSVTPAILT
jgi:hypothetical protein